MTVVSAIPNSAIPADWRRKAAAVESEVSIAQNVEAALVPGATLVEE